MTNTVRNFRVMILLAVVLCTAIITGCENTVPTDSPLPKPHGEQFDNPSEEGFHGKVLLASRYRDMMDTENGCARCHGSDFAGSGSTMSCSGSGCHVKSEGGPTACYTCHGDFITKQVYPVNSPAHTAHLAGGSTSATVVACSGCHTIPTSWKENGHIDAIAGAEVLLKDTLAAIKTKGGIGIPGFVSATMTCENVYCHGNFTNGNNFAPQWKGQNQGKCGTCHGDPVTGNPLPKAPHPSVETCQFCHTGVVDANKTIIDKTKHINGKLNAFGAERTDW